MEQGTKLISYLKSKLIQYEIDHVTQTIKINNSTYSLVDASETVFDDEMNFLPTNDLENPMIYEFAGRWYVNNMDEEITLEELIYFGEAKQKCLVNLF